MKQGKFAVRSAAQVLKLATCAILSMTGLLGVPVSVAQDGWPSKAIRIIVPVAAGSATDLVARQLAPKISEQLGQQVVVDNRPGADMGIGIIAAARSPADGYTWLLVSSTLTSSPVLKKVGFDPVTDFAPVSILGWAATVAVVPPALGVKNIAEFVALARSRPGQLNYANPAVGSMGHLNSAMLEHAAGIDMAGVIYKGSSSAMVDLMANRVNFMMMPTGVALSQVKSGNLLALGVVGQDRSPLYPDVPTLKEQGYAEVILEAWMGVMMPAGTSPAIIKRANEALSAALKDPGVKEALEQAGLRVTPNGTPQAFSERICQDSMEWPKIFEVAKVKPE